MRVENPIRSFLLLAFRTHRKQPRRFVDHDDRVVQMDDSELMVLKRRVGHLPAYRNCHDVARLQLRIMPDHRLALRRHRSAPEKVRRLLTRQSQRQARQILQELASGWNPKATTRRCHEAQRTSALESGDAEFIHIDPLSY